MSSLEKTPINPVAIKVEFNDGIQQISIRSHSIGTLRHKHRKEAGRR
jgi:hypothetical protein